MDRPRRSRRIQFEEVMQRVMANEEEEEDNNEASEDERKEILYV